MTGKRERSSTPVWEADVVLSDGGTMHVRPIRPDDGELIVAFHERQSAESIYFRYFSPRPRLTEADIERLTHVDGVDRQAFVGLIDGELVGIARYDRFPSRSQAEVAFFTDDHHAGRGMATVLLEYLAASAREVGITAFTAQVIPTNRRMLGVFRQVGFEVTSHFSDGVIEVEFPIEPTDEALGAMAERARRSEAMSVARVLAPRSVAVIGASRDAGSLGHEVFRNLLAAGFVGPVYPINRDADVVASVRAHPTILDVPDEVDLAVVAVPAEEVSEVVEQCGRKRVRGLVVISAGFSEAGPEGARRERDLVEQVRRLGLRLVGPNTMGVLNTAPSVQVRATFAPVAPRPGRVAVSSQSGTMGAALLRRLDRLGVGVSSFVATGNKADVSGNDLLQYWETDAATDVIVLYLESFGNPRHFARIARHVGRTKPIVAVKTGRTLPARVDHGPHAGGVDAAVAPDADARESEALLAQTGVIRVDTLDQLFDVVRLLVDQPLPPGRRVAVLSNFWSPAVLASDACVAAGLELAELDPDALARDLGPKLPAGTRLGNPLELTSDAGPDEMAAAARFLLGSSAVDALLVLHAPSLRGDLRAVAGALASVGTDPRKPVVASFLATDLPGERPAGTVPVYDFPEAAAHALGRAARYHEWRVRQTGSIPNVSGVDGDAARALAAELLTRSPDQGEDGVTVGFSARRRLLECVGVRTVTQIEVGSEDEAVAAGGSIGWPVALKALGVERPSRSEEGGVAVDIFDEPAMRGHYSRMREYHGPAMEAAAVQEMAPHGVDCRIDVVQHPVMGSVMAFGAFLDPSPPERILPLTDADAVAMVERGPLADELTGTAEAGRAALVDLLLRLSALADAVPEVAELRLGPVIVSDHRAAVTDLRLRLARWPDEPPVRQLAKDRRG